MNSDPRILNLEVTSEGFMLLMNKTPMTNSRYDLQQRLLNFSSEILDLVQALPKDRIGHHLGNQLMRSGTSPCLNYAEAMGAESQKDFIHKLRIALKELRESQVCLQLLDGRGYVPTSQSKLWMRSINSFRFLLKAFKQPAKT